MQLRTDRELQRLAGTVAERWSASVLHAMALGIETRGHTEMAQRYQMEGGAGVCERAPVRNDPRAAVPHSFAHYQYIHTFFAHTLALHTRDTSL